MDGIGKMHLGEIANNGEGEYTEEDKVQEEITDKDQKKSTEFNLKLDEIKAIEKNESFLQFIQKDEISFVILVD